MNWHPYGYTGAPETCRWCGRKLRYKRVIAEESDKGNPTYRLEGPGGTYATIRAGKPGGYQDGLFCGLSCGYLWARRMAPARWS